jgi:hypothetical protein
LVSCSAVHSVLQFPLYFLVYLCTIEIIPIVHVLQLYSSEVGPRRSCVYCIYCVQFDGLFLQRPVTTAKFILLNSWLFLVVLLELISKVGTYIKNYVGDFRHFNSISEKI